ncbi:hypothetical protein ACLB2K_075639 [Fragaria x ananassa]
MVQLLSMEDFTSKQLRPGSTLDILGQVACVAREKLRERRKKIQARMGLMGGGSSTTLKIKRSREDDVDDHDKGSQLKQQKKTNKEPNSPVGNELVVHAVYSVGTIRREKPSSRANHMTSYDLGFHEKNGLTKKKKSSDGGEGDHKYLSLKPKKKNMKSKKAKRLGFKMPNKEHMIRTPRYSTDPNDLPEDLKMKIETLEGIESFEKAKMTLVIEKRLFSTDLTDSASRLSMPLKQIKPESFLDEDEIKFLASQHDWPVSVISPKLEEESLTLRQWNMNKNNGNVSSSYVLKSGWNEVHQKNQLEKDDVIQVWSFRDVGNNLHFAIVLVEKATEGGSGSSDGEVRSRRSSSRSTTLPSNNDADGEKSSSDIGQETETKGLESNSSGSGRSSTPSCN